MMTTQIDDEEEVQEERMSPLRTGLIVGGILLVAGVIGVAALYFLGDESDASPFASSSIDDSERAAIESTISGFIADAGTFGVDEEEYSANDFHAIYQQWRNAPSVSESLYEDVFTLRDEAYLSMREEYIVPDSPLWYNAENIEEWETIEDVYEHRSFSVDPDTVSLLYLEEIHDPETDETEDGGIDSDFRLAEATVEWTSDERIREEVGRRGQSDWNGSVRVLERQYVDTTATVVVAEVGDEWMIYNHDVNNPHLLSTWDSISELPEHDSFTEVATMTPTPELRTLTEVGDGEYEDAEGNTVTEDEIRPGEHIVSQGFYNYCSEDMPEQYGNPEDDGFTEVRDGDDCTWVREDDQDFHPDESELGS